ncbi:MAG: C-terminal binding protein [Desulfotignum sp.]|nr:C-terminal binding protein [Desulfotignum sp.]MCF8126286.1 C-terminal binding protein [Desulfotignum sp.]
MNRSSPFNVVITDHAWPDLTIETDIFSPLGIRLTAAQCKTQTDVIKIAARADAVNAIHSPITQKVVEALANCKIISMSSSGCDTVDIDAVTNAGILLVNCPDYCVEEVADHTMAMLLSCARGIFLFDRRLKENIWDYRSAGNLERIRNATLGLVGFGKVGRAVAKRANVFGMKILAADPHTSAGTRQDLKIDMTSLQELLSSADYVSVHTPLTTTTKGLISQNELRCMKNSAFILNTSRGGVIDEQALYNALIDGTIRGAALDVLEKEPPDFNTPLLNLDNVLVTPHAAFYSKDALEEVRTRSAKAIVDVFNGNLPDHIVNKDVVNNGRLRMAVGKPFNH